LRGLLSGERTRPRVRSPDPAAPSVIRDRQPSASLRLRFQKSPGSSCFSAWRMRCCRLT